MTSNPRARVLIADDEPHLLDSLAALLRGQGYECVCVQDASSCKQMLSEQSFDVLIADIFMPGNSELELLARLQEPLPVILMTGNPTVRSAVRSIKLPVTAYLIKPFEFKELLDEVERAVGTGRTLRRHGRAGEELSNGLMRATFEDEDEASADASFDDKLKRHLGPRGGADIDQVNALSNREKEVLWMVLKGESVANLAAQLNISTHTVRNHLKAIHRKLGVRSRTELLVRFGPVRDSAS